MSSAITKLSKRLNLPCVDSDGDLEIKLTEADIKRGIAGSAEHCGFANACKRQFPVHGAYFFKSVAYIQTNKEIIRFILPQAMAREIEYHDRVGTVMVMKPGAYKLLQPKGAQAMGAVRKRSAKRPGRHKPSKTPSGIQRKPRLVNVRQLQIPPNVKTKRQLRAWLEIALSV